MKGVDFDATVVPDCLNHPDSLNHPDISYHVGLANHVNCLCTVIRMETQQSDEDNLSSHKVSKLLGDPL